MVISLFCLFLKPIAETSSVIGGARQAVAFTEFSRDAALVLRFSRREKQPRGCEK